MPSSTKRIAINFGGGYVPGLNAVIMGVVLAANEFGWEVVGIRDGFDGLLFPDRYGDTGLVSLGLDLAERMFANSGSILGTAARSDPFHVRIADSDGMLEEVDHSDTLLETIRARGIDAVISVAGVRALSILLKLSRKGLKTVVVPKSIENDMAATDLSFGFNSALSFTAETIDRARQAAEATRQIGVVEVPGEHAGWLALQAGTAVCADVILIPEIPYDLQKVATMLRKKASAGRAHALIVAAEGAIAVNEQAESSAILPADSLKASLSPDARGESGAYVIGKSGRIAERVALELQRLTHHESFPLVLGELVRGGPPTTVDRQLALSYGAAAIRALHEDRSGVMVSFQPPELKFEPLLNSINRVRTVPADSAFVQVARALGISLGD